MRFDVMSEVRLKRLSSLVGWGPVGIAVQLVSELVEHELGSPGPPLRRRWISMPRTRSSEAALGKARYIYDPATLLNHIVLCYFSSLITFS